MWYKCVQLVPKGSPNTSVSHSESPGGPSEPERADWLRLRSMDVELRQYHPCHHGLGEMGTHGFKSVSVHSTHPT